MKQNVRKALAISGLAIAIGTSGMIFDASAKEGNYNRNHIKKEQRVLPNKTTTTRATRRVTVGTVTAVAADSITIDHRGTSYIVTFDANTKFINKAWQTIATTDIQTGNTVRILGTVSDTTIAAKTIRDISL